MVFITATAQAQLEALEDHYARLGRDLAAVRMLEAVALAKLRIEKGLGPFYDAPRPYPGIQRAGWRWLKEGAYWIAFTDEPGMSAILAIFYEAANIPGRL